MRLHDGIADTSEMLSTDLARSRFGRWSDEVVQVPVIVARLTPNTWLVACSKEGGGAAVPRRPCPSRALA
jgi:hypothetical protein